MPVPFFPDGVFAGAFLGTLGVILVTASVLDLRFMTIPKWLTVTALPLGLIFNAIRLGWLAAIGQPAGWFHADQAWLGTIDGLLFAVAGFFAGFGLFLILWLLGVAGGGDVKLFAAVGAWVGPYLAVAVLAVTLVILAGVVLWQTFWLVVTGGFHKLKRQRERKGVPVKPQRRLIAFALPLSIATGLVLAWALRNEFKPAPRATAVAQGESHVVR